MRRAFPAIVLEMIAGRGQIPRGRGIIGAVIILLLVVVLIVSGVDLAHLLGLSAKP